MTEILKLDDIFEKAFRFFLLNEVDSYVYRFRNSGGFDDYYARLDKEVRRHPFLKITALRPIKEGRIKVSRPSEVTISKKDFFKQCPVQLAIYNRLLEAKGICHLVDFDAFLEANFAICVRRHIVLKEAIELFQYLIKDEDQIKGLLPRQLQHSFSTKLIGKEPLLLALLAFHTGQAANWETFFEFFGLIKRPPEFRFYAPQCKWSESILKQFHGVLFQENIATFCFQNLERTLVIENIESLLPLVGKCDKTLLIWGEGWKCSQLIPLSAQLPKPIFYWGDLDKEGLEIADKFISGTSARPILMDEATIDSNIHLKEAVEKSPSTKRRSLRGLQAAYARVISDGIRIEQEKLWLNLELLQSPKDI